MSGALTALFEEHVVLVIAQSNTVEITWLRWVFVEQLVVLLRLAELMIVNLMILVDV